MLKCADCEFEVSKVKHLENHINAEHLNEKRFSCNLCDFQSFYSQRVKSHILFEHEGSTKAQMKTLECSDGYKKSNNLLETFSGIIGLFMKHTETQDSL